jgi:hypothetical protein
VLLLAGAFEVARAESGSAPIFPLAEVKPGLIGEVTTVIAGREPATLQVEILGVLERGIGADVDMILGRLRGELGEWNGVAAGMSGSPVRIDGRLVGALSYSIGAFTKEPICGITPIQNMLDLDQYPGGERPWLAADAVPTADAAAATPTPLPMMLIATGLSARAIHQLPETLKEFGLTAPQVIASTAGVLHADASAAIEPQAGMPVAALVVWGDVKLGATGTVTYNDGTRVLAFGHPFLGTGSVSIPMARADVVWTVPSALGSYKISRLGDPIGVWEQDRLTAIAGRVGAKVEGVEVNVRIERDGIKPRPKKFFVLHDPYFTPAFAAAATRGLLLDDIGVERDEALHLSASVRLTDGQQFEFEAFGPGGLLGSPDGVITGELAARLQQLTRAPWPIAKLERIDLQVRVAHPDGRWVVERVSPDRIAARAGESIVVRVSLEGTRGQRREETLKLQIPRNQPAGPLALLVGSARSLAAETGAVWEAKRRTARNAAEYLAAWRQWPSENQLEAVLIQSTDGVVANGREYPVLPPSANLLMQRRLGGSDQYRARWWLVDRDSARLDRQVAEFTRSQIEVLP